RLLMDATPEQFGQYLTPLIDGYEDWLEKRRADAHELPAHLHGVAESGVKDGEDALKRLREGLGLLTDTSSGTLNSENARKAFSFMNRTMRDQRIRSQIAGLRAADREMTVAEATKTVEAKGDNAASWRAF